MITLIILAFVLLVLPVIGVWPPIVRAQKTTNNFLLIMMRDPAWYETRGQFYRPIVSHEAAEWYLRWLVALPIGSLSLFFDTGQYQWAVLVMSALIATIWSIIFYGQVDLIGRAAEVLADGRPGYLEAEAERLRIGTNKTFADVATVDLAKMIEKRFWIARILLWLMSRRISRAMK